MFRRRDHAEDADREPCLKFVEPGVLARSTETVSDTANRMYQRMGLPVVHFAAQASEIDVNDIHRLTEMKILLDVLQQHRPRHDAVFVAHQMLAGIPWAEGESPCRRRGSHGPVVDSSERADDQEGRSHAAVAQLAHHGNAIEVGKHTVDRDHGKVVCRAVAQRFVAAGNQIHL